ncbi:hypothetical protein HV144_13085 [Citrobacter freundii]|nr:hypothetical protein [Citrobacter freundii]
MTSNNTYSGKPTAVQEGNVM